MHIIFQLQIIRSYLNSFIYLLRFYCCILDDKNQYQFGYVYNQINKLILLSILLALLLSQTHQAKYKAMLYCHLPAVNTSNKTAELSQLSRLINELLADREIDVEVQACNDKNSLKLYNQTQISQLFDEYDIVELDVSYLWAVTQKIELLKVKRSQIKYYHQAYSFEWTPLVIQFDEGQDEFIGSPGLICSTFIEKRVNLIDKQYERRLYAKFTSKSKIIYLYLNTYINLYQQKTLSDVDYINVDKQTIEKMKQFLKDCQEDNSIFNSQINWCLDKSKLKTDFFDTDYSTTIGYSQDLFNFANKGVLAKDIEIKHINNDKHKVVVYLDSFVAKSTVDKKIALKFYQFMLSDEVMDIYIKGKYTTNTQNYTYLIPPSKTYMRKLKHENFLYKLIERSVLETRSQHVLYQKAYAQNLATFAEKIYTALKEVDKTEEQTDTSDSDKQYSHLRSMRPHYLQARMHKQ